MLEAQEKEAINKGMQTLWLIWAAMLSSLLIYIFVCHLLGEGLGRVEEPDVPIELLKKILYGVAAVTLIASYRMRKFMLKGPLSRFEANIARRSSNLNHPPFVGQYTVAVIISLAIVECIGIYGLTLFFLGESFQTLYTFIVVSALAMVFFCPKREELKRLAEIYRKRDGSTPEM